MALPVPYCTSTIITTDVIDSDHKRLEIPRPACLDDLLMPPTLAKYYYNKLIILTSKQEIKY